jgi:succinyl-CoA synthetase alpha subunit
LKLFERDSDTHAIVLIGEVGGMGELEAANYIKKKMNKPVFALITGINAPPGKKMDHAGAIVSGEKTTAQAKINALKDAGVLVIEGLFDSPEAIFPEIQ